MMSEQRDLHLADALLEHLRQVQEQTATMIDSLQKARHDKTPRISPRRTLQFAAGGTIRQAPATTRCTW